MTDEMRKWFHTNFFKRVGKEDFESGIVRTDEEINTMIYEKCKSMGHLKIYEWYAEEINKAYKEGFQKAKIDNLVDMAFKEEDEEKHYEIGDGYFLMYRYDKDEDTEMVMLFRTGDRCYHYVSTYCCDVFGYHFDWELKDAIYREITI